jgi:penicillin-insensitive murein DD-endopeptidase
MWDRASLLFCLCTLACSRVPSPLTPSFRGSVGLPHLGSLSDGVELPRKGPAHRWYSASGHHFGTPQMVEAIQYAAGRVRTHYPDSPPLLVGDLSARRGGKLAGHASHRTGRDADLLFYMTTLSGRPVQSEGFLKFGADGLAQAGPREWVQFDLPRNWALVKALVEGPGPGVVWLFVSRPLEALITEYALARGEDPALVWHAESVMLQPTNAAAHDDHFHLRLACTPEQAVAGCEDGGPQWPWFRAPPSLVWPDSEEAVYAAIEAETLPALGLDSKAPKR